MGRRQPTPPPIHRFLVDRFSVPALARALGGGEGRHRDTITWAGDESYQPKSPAGKNRPPLVGARTPVVEGSDSGSPLRARTAR